SDAAPRARRLRPTVRAGTDAVADASDPAVTGPTVGPRRSRSAMQPDIERPNDHPSDDHASVAAGLGDPVDLGGGRHRLRTGVLAVLGVVAVLVGVTVSTGVAEARRQCSTDRYTHRITDVQVSRLATNLRSDYLRGPGTISYAKTKTAEVNASVS